MTRSLSAKTLLLKSFLALPSLMMRQYLMECAREEECWVCGSRTHWSPRAVFERHFDARTGEIPGRAWGIVKSLKGDRGVSRENLRKRLSERGAFGEMPDDGNKVAFVPMCDPFPHTKDGFRANTTREVYRVYVVTSPVDKDSVVQILDLSFKSCRDRYDPCVPEGTEGKRIVLATRHGAKGSTETYYTFVTGSEVARDAQTLAREKYDAYIKDMENVPF